MPHDREGAVVDGLLSFIDVTAQGPPRTRIVDGEIVREDDVGPSQTSHRQPPQANDAPTSRQPRRPQRPQPGAQIYNLNDYDWPCKECVGFLCQQTPNRSLFRRYPLVQELEHSISAHSQLSLPQNLQSSPCLACLA